MLAAGATSSVTFTLTNSGDATGDIKSVTISGAAAFTVTGNTCTGISLPTNHSCTVTVAYMPTKPGESDTATLVATAKQASASLKLLGSEVVQAPQTITFSSVSPTDATVDGATYTPVATASPSGLPVVFSIDSSSTAGACSISSGAVSFTGAGTCVIDANQAGDSNWQAAAQVQQTVTVNLDPQTISFSSSVPSDATVGGPGYTPVATGGGSDEPVVFSVDSSSTAGACTISSGVVSFTGGGSCVIDANQAGDGVVYAPAAQVQQTIPVGPGAQTISFTSPAPYGAVGGTPYPVTASATSGLPVTITVDSSSTNVCAIVPESGTDYVNFIGTGTCTLDANQAGDGTNWQAATEVTQSVSVPNILLSVTSDLLTDPQTPVLPPDPATLNCDPQTKQGGGCEINPLDGSTDNYFDASATLNPGDGPGFDPSLYNVTYHWQIYKPPGLASALYSSNGITGYHASLLDIQPNSLPELLGTNAGNDIYWRVQLTVTINGVTATGFFKFIYQSSTLSLQLSTYCQYAANAQTQQCQLSAANGLPATEPT